MSEEQKEITIESRLEAAAEARNSGVPVDLWVLLVDTYNSMASVIKEQRESIEQLENPANFPDDE